MITSRGVFWNKQDDALSWAEAATSSVGRVLGSVFAGGLVVEPRLPDAETAKNKVSANLDLLAEIVLRWSGLNDKPLRLEIPMPYNGVFVKHRDDSGTPGLAVASGWPRLKIPTARANKPPHSRQRALKRDRPTRTLTPHGPWNGHDLAPTLRHLSAYGIAPRGKWASAYLVRRNIPTSPRAIPKGKNLGGVRRVKVEAPHTVFAGSARDLEARSAAI